jgi:phosphopantothenoylcysteine synthetase/decarboxylase
MSCLFCSCNGFRYVQASLYYCKFSSLTQFGNTIIPAESGELASVSGEGRMAEPENIVAFIEDDLNSKLPLKGKKILITAGPTYEAIDPVRFMAITHQVKWVLI